MQSWSPGSVILPGGPLRGQRDAALSLSRFTNSLAFLTLERKGAIGRELDAFSLLLFKTFAESVGTEAK